MLNHLIKLMPSLILCVGIISNITAITNDALIGFSNVPQEGKVRCAIKYTPLHSIEEYYDSSGNLTNLDKYKISENLMILDYYGYNQSGWKIKFLNSTIDYGQNQIENISMIDASIYFIWLNQFPFQTLKTELGYSDSLGVFINQTLDYDLTKKQIWSNQLTVSGNNTIAINSKIIYNFSKNMGASILYNHTKYQNNDIDNNDMHINNIEISMGLKLRNLNYGYYKFDIRIKPTYKIPISGINTPSAQSLSLGLMIDFI